MSDLTLQTPVTRFRFRSIQSPPNLLPIASWLWYQSYGSRSLTVKRGLHRDRIELSRAATFCVCRHCVVYYVCTHCSAFMLIMLRCSWCQ